MRFLAWLLIHHPRTVALADLERAVRGELALRAGCAVAGQRSPNQWPPIGPAEWAFLGLLVLAVARFAW